jgi:hypothetical protein
MAKNLIIMLVVLVVGLLAVWSWFTVNKEVAASSIKVEAAHPNKIGLAKVIKYYDPNNSSNNKEGPGVFKDTLEFSSTDFQFTKDCTGDAKTLIVPDFSVTKDPDEARRKGREVNPNGVWEQALSNINVGQILARKSDEEVEARYMEFEFYARSKNRVINLAQSSFLKGETEVDEHSLSETSYQKNGVTVDKKSAYGNFNVDALVGAIRVGLVAQGASNVSQTIESSEIKLVNGVPQTTATLGDEEATLIWNPRPDIWLNTDNEIGKWSIRTDVKESTDEIGAKSYCHEYYEPKTLEEGVTNFFNTTVKQNVTTSGTTVTGLDNNSLIFGICVKNGSLNTPLNLDNSVSRQRGTGVVLRPADTPNPNPNILVTDDTTCPNLGKDKDISKVSYRDMIQTSNIPVENVSGQNDNYYVYKYKLRVWIEGTDNEARRAMDGGVFQLRLEFK